MAFFERDDEGDAYYELHLTDEEAVVLHTVLRHISGFGKTRDVVNKIVDAFHSGGIGYSSDIKPVEGKDDLRFND